MKRILLLIKLVLLFAFASGQMIKQNTEFTKIAMFTGKPIVKDTCFIVTSGGDTIWEEIRNDSAIFRTNAGNWGFYPPLPGGGGVVHGDTNTVAFFDSSATLTSDSNLFLITQGADPTLTFMTDSFNGNIVTHTLRLYNHHNAFADIICDTLITVPYYPFSLPNNNPQDFRLLQSHDNGSSSWETINNVAWGLTGNTGTNPATNFIGTTDTSRLSFRVNNRGVAEFTDYNMYLNGGDILISDGGNSVVDINQQTISITESGVYLALETNSLTKAGAFSINVDSLSIINGTQSTGKVLTSDANGLASWQTPNGVGITTTRSILYFGEDSALHANDSLTFADDGSLYASSTVTAGVYIAAPTLIAWGTGGFTSGEIDILGLGSQGFYNKIHGRILKTVADIDLYLPDTIGTPNSILTNDGTGYLNWQNPDSLLPYYKYVAVIVQNDTTQPITVTVLENTLGNIAWSNSPGNTLIGNLNNAFTIGKTFFLMQQVEIISTGLTLATIPAGLNDIEIVQYDSSVNAIAGFSFNIEIRVYK